MARPDGVAWGTQQLHVTEGDLASLLAAVTRFGVSMRQR